MDKASCLWRDRAVLGLTDGGAPGLEQEHDVGAIDWGGLSCRHGYGSPLGSAYVWGATLKLAIGRCAAEAALGDRPSLRDLVFYFSVLPALKRWATLGRPSGAGFAVLFTTSLKLYPLEFGHTQLYPRPTH